MTAVADPTPPHRAAGPDADPQALARAHWRAAAATVAGTDQMIVSWDGGRTYPARPRRQLPLSADPPNQPVTVFVYDPAQGAGRTLVCDFDTGKAREAGAPDPLAAVAADAAEFATLIALAGGRCIQDVSPSGGRHAYVLWERPQPWLELKRLTRALALRFATLDVSPMQSLTGLIRPPGSRYKLSDGRSPGWQMLTTPEDDVREITTRRCGHQVWYALHTALGDELDRIKDDLPETAAPATPGHDGDAAPYLPRTARRPLRPDLSQIARTGRYPARYASGNEARMAVLCSAAARGWQLHHVTTAIHGGTWPGLARLYQRYPASSRPGAISRDWEKAVRIAGRQKTGDEAGPGKSAPRSHTRHQVSHPRGPDPPEVAPADPRKLTVHELIWAWRNAIWLAERDPGRRGSWGGAAVSVRLVLRALAAAMQMTKSMQVEFGCRSLAIHAKVSYRTAAEVLAVLRSEDDPLIVLVKPGRGLRADQYRLRIPDAYRDDALWYRWRPGVLKPVHPVFRVLGGAAFLLYDILGAEAAPVAELAQATAVSPATVRKAARLLGEHGMAVRGPRGWCRGPASPDRVAAVTGADLLDEEVRQAYARQRSDWVARLARHDLPTEDDDDGGRGSRAHVVLGRTSDPMAGTPPRAPPGGEPDLAHLRLLERVLGARVLVQ